MKDKLINNSLNKIRLKYPEFTNTKLEEIKYGIESLYLTITKMIILIILSIIFNIKKDYTMLEKAVLVFEKSFLTFFLSF